MARHLVARQMHQEVCVTKPCMFKRACTFYCKRMQTSLATASRHLHYLPVHASERPRWPECLFAFFWLSWGTLEVCCEYPPLLGISPHTPLAPLFKPPLSATLMHQPCICVLMLRAGGRYNLWGLAWNMHPSLYSTA